ncbi:MAG: carboxypeptidase regulatory-like domain-containing protein [Thermoanaerobaculia bacterium]|nr:carboxypeptidase regulatory-like domain-containing protein [Thermoanaerobaculia bacterium]
MRRGRRFPRLAAFWLACPLAAACVSAPRLTDEAIRRESNARATVTGTVRDASRRPVAGIQVVGLPRDRDLGWSAPAISDAEGRFRLELIAPGDYGFLLFWNGISVITASADEPARVRVPVRPAAERAGVELTFLREEWERTLAESGQRTR